MRPINHVPPLIKKKKKTFASILQKKNGQSADRKAEHLTLINIADGLLRSKLLGASENI